MAVSVLILCAASLLLLGFSLRSRYGLPLLLMTFGMAVTAVAVLLQLHTQSLYTPAQLPPFRTLDLTLFRLFRSLRVPVTRAQYLRNIGCLIFFGGVLFLLLLIIRNLRDPRARKTHAVIACVFFGLFCCLYLVFFSPAAAFRIYTRFCSLAGEAQQAFRSRVEAVCAVFLAVTCLAVAAPLIMLVWQYLRRRITYFADTFSLLCCMTAVYGLLFSLTFFSGPFAQSSGFAVTSGFWYLPASVRVPGWISSVYLFFSLLLLALILFSTNRIFSGELVFFSRKRAMKNSIEELNHNLKDVLHSEKNLMFSMLILSNEVREAYGTEKGLEKLDRLSEIASHRMESITSSLNRIRELHLNPQPVDMRLLTDQAMDDLPLPEGIRCEKHYCAYPARCLIDEYHTRSALKNLFANSVEALQLSGAEDMRISVTVDASREWVSLSVRDNGPGIEKREIRHVMLPFVSTKSKTSNWGIGLPYVFRVVNAQLGQMRIQSSVKPGNHFTQVDILLPRERGKDQ